MVAATTTTSCRFVHRFGSLVRCCMLLTVVVAMVKRLFAIVCFVFVMLCDSSMFGFVIPPRATRGGDDDEDDDDDVVFIVVSWS